MMVLFGKSKLSHAWGPWLRGEDINRQLDRMAMRFLKPESPCPRCGTELLYDEPDKVYFCHLCKKSWPKLDLVLEVLERKKLGALAELCAAAGADPGELATPTYMMREPIVVDGRAGGYPPPGAKP